VTQGQQRLQLQPSEAHVLHAASRIYSAYVLAGKVGEATEAQWLERSLSEALYLAQRADVRIQSDDEVGGGGLKGSGFSGPPIGG
jgi:hypothetical protein